MISETLLELLNLILNDQSIYYIIDVILIVILLKSILTLHVNMIPNNIQEGDQIALAFNTNKKKKKHLLSILRIENIPRYDLLQKQTTEHINNFEKMHPFGHLIGIHHTGVKFVYETHIRKQHTTIQFAVSKIVDIKEEEDAVIEDVEVLKTAFRSIYPAVRFKILTQQDLIKGYELPLIKIPGNIETHNNFIRLIDDEFKERFLGVLKLEGTFEVKNSEKAPIDILIDGLSAEKIDASLFIFAKALNKKLFKKSKKKLKSKREYNKRGRGGHAFRNALNSKENEELQELFLRENTGEWEISVYLMVISNSSRQLERDIKKASTVIISAFAGYKNNLNVKKLKKTDLQKSIVSLLTRHITRYSSKMSSLKLSALIHLPKEPHPGLTRTDIPKFDIPNNKYNPIINNTDFFKLHEAKIKENKSNPEKMIFLGNALWHENELAQVFLPISDLQLHTVVLGESGFGKTIFVKNLIQRLYKTAPEIDWLIFDYKGEYLDLKNFCKDVKIITPGDNDSGLCINIFDPGVDSIETHKQKLFLLLYEIVSKVFKKSEYSPQMERCLKDAISHSLTFYMKQKNVKIRPFDLLFKSLDQIADQQKKNMPSIAYSVEGIKSRLDRFKSGILSKIFNTTQHNITPRDFSRGKIIINLRELIRNGATLLELKFVMAIIFKYILDLALRRDSDNLKHVTVIEEANTIIPSTKEEDYEGIFETAVLNVRSLGEGLIFIAQRPTISENILVNAGTKVLFRNPWEASILAKYINLDKVQEEYLRTLPIGEAIVMIPQYPYPFRLKSINEFPENQIQNIPLQTTPKLTQKKEYKNKKQKIRPIFTRADIFDLASHILEDNYYPIIKEIIQILKQDKHTFEELQALLPKISPSIIRFILNSLASTKPPVIIRGEKYIELSEAGFLVCELLIDEIEIPY